FHQSLTPQSVLVEEGDRGPAAKVFSWQAGTSEPGTVSGTRLTAHHILKVGLAGEAQGAVYLAPELYSGARTNPARLDDFSLGALTYHLVSGAAPAATVEELHEKLLRGPGLRLSEVMDGVDRDLEDLVQLATAPDTRDRLELDGFLAILNGVIAALGEAPGTWPNPLEAAPGDELEGGFRVVKRLGKGSTAVALLVVRDEREGVLKVALDAGQNDRLRHEGQVLREVQHQNVVTLHEITEVSGHAALFMSVAGTRTGDDGAGSYTLAQRIRDEGRLSLDLLQRFGEELLGVVNWLEHNGISHRDVKPDNIGIGQTRQGTLTLFLFDFSLSGVPAENVRAGTPPYLDPFLAQRKPPRWDAYAERFATAVTLYEMATGKTPVWGDGQSNPALLDCEATLEEELFDSSVRERLGRFFRKAVARDFRKRFDNAEEMRRAWMRVFEEIDRPATRSDDGQADVLAALEGVDESSPVAALPLTPRVLNALERMGVHTLAELLGLPRIRLYRNKGIGQPVVREIREVAENVARHFALRAARSTDPGAAEQDPAVEPQFWSVDLMARRLAGAADGDDAPILRALLGLDRPAGVAGEWPATQDVAEALGFARHEVQAAVDRARERWGRDRKGWLVPLRDSVAALLEKHGGVMTRAELVGALLAQRGSSAAGGERERSAGAVAYAAVEAEAAREGARFVLYRGRELLVLATPSLAEPFAATPGARARYAELLGARADELAAADPLLPRERAEEELLAVPAPEGDRPLPADRMLRLAVAASRGAALSSRMEVYPRGMGAVRALRLGAGSLLGPKSLATRLVQERVASRYPEAERLPDRPALDALLDEAGLPYRWDEGRGGFAPADARYGPGESTSTTGRRPSLHGGADGEPGADEAAAMERRLAAVASEGRFLVLTVDPRRHPAAVRELARRHGLACVSLETLFLRELRAAADAIGARWDVVVRADAAGRDSRDWRNLLHVAARAAQAVAGALQELREPAVLVYPGLLARYGQLAVLEQLRVRA
ncbi:MAG TPA: BREX system serine/threonine kinase PglW, partial [Longimicrobiaceae bacterium]|nr:BREX system serine/threonine kinase PglW [Longimicrobiaceae bacterium]